MFNLQRNIGNLNFFSSLSILVFYLIVVIKTANNGFDFTDEGYYITSMDHLSEWGFTASPFGLLFSYAYEFFNYNIGILRTLSFIFIVFLSSYFVYYYKFTFARKGIFDRKRTTSASIVASLLLISIYYIFGGRTPSYNFLYISAVITYSIAFLKIKNHGFNFNAGILIGLGTLFSIFGRTLQGFAITILFIFLIFIMFFSDKDFRKVFPLRFVGGLSVFNLVGVVVLIDKIGNFERIIEWFKFSIKWSMAMNPDAYDFRQRVFNYLSEIKQFALSSYSFYFNEDKYFFFALATLLLYSIFKKNVFLFQLYELVLFVQFLLTLLNSQPEMYVYNIGILLFVVFTSNVFFELITQTKKLKDLFNEKIIFIFLFFAVIVHGLGSANGLFYIFGMSGGIIALTLISSTKIERIAYEFIRNFIFLSVAVSIFLVTIQYPYRTQNLLKADTMIELSPIKHNSINLDKNSAESILQIRHDLSLQGWTAGTPILQLGEWKPGLIYMLGGDTGSSTLTTQVGYPGAFDAAKMTLRFIAPDFVCRAWIYSDMPEFIDIEKLMSEFSIDFPKDYVEIGNFYKPKKNNLCD